MKVAVYGKQFQDNVTPFVLELFQELEKVQIEVIVYEPFYNFLSQQMNLNLFLGTYNSYEELKKGVDLFISIGGDGTILDATTIIRDSEIPIIGVNTGRLGFLADIAKNEIPKTNWKSKEKKEIPETNWKSEKQIEIQETNWKSKKKMGQKWNFKMSRSWWGIAERIEYSSCVRSRAYWPLQRIRI